MVGSFKVLQAQWKSLKTEADKKEWIKNNQTAFDNLNLSVWNVNDAYDVFVKNAPKVVAALKAIAEAEAYQDLYKEAIKKKAVEWDNRNKSRATGDYYTTAKPGDRSFTIDGSEGTIPENWRRAGIGKGRGTNYEWGKGQSGAGYWVLDEEGARKLNEYRNKAAQELNRSLESSFDATINIYGDLMDAANERAERAKAELNTYGGTGTRPSASGRSSGNSGRNTSHHTNPSRTTHSAESNKEEPIKGSLGDLEKQLSELQQKYKDGLITLSTEEYLKQVSELEEKIKAKKIELGIDIVAETPEGSLKRIEELLA